MTISGDFWATTAQVIPTLLLAYMVERRAFRGGESTRKHVAVALVLLIMAFVMSAEFLALNGVLGHGGAWQARIVIVAIGMITSLIAVQFLFSFADQSLFPTKEPDDPVPEDVDLGTSRALAMVTTFAAMLTPLGASLWFAASV